MKNTFILFALFSLFSLFEIYAQHYEPFTPIQKQIEAPSVYEYTKYENTPVNLSSGTPQIELNLYTIIQDGINVPLSIKYLPKGIKVNEEASWVGLGWTMNFPRIHQQINDIDDLEKYRSGSNYLFYLPPFPSNLSPGIKDLKFFKLSRNFSNYNPLDVCGTFSLTNGNQITDNIYTFKATNYTLPINDVINDVWHIDHSDNELDPADIFSKNVFVDSEPDIFKITLFDITLNVVYDRNTSKFIILNNLQYRIDYNPTDFSFIVYSIDGSKYIFGSFLKTGYSITTYPFNQQNNYGSYPSSSVSSNIWYLKKIITPLESEINFEYLTTSIPVNENDNINISEIYYKPSLLNASWTTTGESEKTNFTLSVGDDQINEIIPREGTYKTFTATPFNSSSERVILNKIKFEKGEIDFNLTNRDDFNALKNMSYKKISNLYVKNNNGEIIKNIQFNYDYLISQTNWNCTSTTPSLQDIKRLFLNEIKINDQTYRKFKYNNTLLPPKTSYATDFWGYFNGFNNRSFIPNPSRFYYSNINIDSQFSSVNNSNNHSSNLDFTKAGVLEEIIFPTNGKRKFEYELNMYNSNVSNKLPNYNNNGSNIIEGVGLRVKSILDVDSDNNLISKNIYIYENGNLPHKIKFLKSSTISNSFVDMFLVYWESTGNLTYACAIDKNKNYNVLESRQNNIYDIGFFLSENEVYYKKVTEIYQNVESEYLSYKKVFNFEFNEYKYPPIIESDYNYYDVYQPALKNRDNLDNGLLLSEEWYDESNILKIKKVYNYENIKSNIYYGVKTNEFLSEWGSFCVYGFLCSPPTLSKAPRHSMTYYPIYNDYSRITSEKTTEYLDNDQTLTNTTSYTYDTKGRMSQKKVFDLYNNAIITNTNYLNFPEVNDYRKISSEYISESKNNVSTVSNQSNYKYLYNFGTKKLLSEYSKCARPIGYEEMRKEFCQTTFFNIYDSKGNLLEYKLENGNYVSLIWGYNQTELIAQIEGVANTSLPSAYVNAVIQSSNSGSENDLLLAFSNLRNQLPNAMVTTYTYKPLIGVSTITDPKGDTNYYFYDTFNRLQYIKNKDQQILKEFSYHYKSIN